MAINCHHIWYRAEAVFTRWEFEIDTRLIVADSCHQVLVVDDTSAVRLVLSRLLERMGHVVKSVESGKQALESLDDYPADIIFSDISMPEMNGYELVREIRKRPETRRRFVIAMTADGECSSEQASLAAGFDAHLTKPFDLGTIYCLLNDPKIILAKDELA